MKAIQTYSIRFMMIGLYRQTKTIKIIFGVNWNWIREFLFDDEELY